MGSGIKVAYENLSSEGGASNGDSQADQSAPESTSEATAAQRLAVQHRSETSEQDLVKGMEKTSLGEDVLVGGPASTNLEGEGDRDVPAVETKAGEPVGDVVFDHPPTKGEIKQALHE